jgi:hypothetical protein
MEHVKDDAVTMFMCLYWAFVYGILGILGSQWC